MNTTKFVTVVVGSDKVSVAEPITRVDHGLRLRIKGIALPATYEVDFSLSEKSGESVTVIGDIDNGAVQDVEDGIDPAIYALQTDVGTLTVRQDVTDNDIATLQDAVWNTGE